MSRILTAGYGDEGRTLTVGFVGGVLVLPEVPTAFIGLFAKSAISIDAEPEVSLFTRTSVVVDN